mgnify:CR=1 FL=1
MRIAGSGGRAAAMSVAASSVSCANTGTAAASQNAASDKSSAFSGRVRPACDRVGIIVMGADSGVSIRNSKRNALGVSHREIQAHSVSRRHVQPLQLLLYKKCRATLIIQG